MTDESAQRRFPRFTRSDRLEHWVQVIAFTGLAITGLIQMWSESAFPKAIITRSGRDQQHSFHPPNACNRGADRDGLPPRNGRISLLRETNRQADAARISTTSELPHTRSRTTSASAAIQRRRGSSRSPRRLEYWSIIWGTVIMAVTGLMMWNPIATTKILPGEFIPAAKAAHGGEAILAVLAILVWHTYFVHVRRFNKSIFTGYLDEEEMIDEHPVQLAAIESGDDTITIPPETLRRRRRVFFPVYAAIVVLAVASVLVFLSYQEIAITTVDPPDAVVEIYTPYVP